ncbi:hypothetical protein SAMN02910384_02023 [Pseudobutyrivibrio sp. ACV-2]|uniref:hypothetical protein n=1 Tax=Pseudobutyrivibrio sp. ACV-2 TaxID=1520801 RepID=UPI00089C0277|nr:hypothetical protein [Pseudobutyrivibrio sp. ACV-2]SEA65903.1 hypothetical protein SAMN02910384_02023 [Pseudobutyrivibrio sp. ACV-2]
MKYILKILGILLAAVVLINLAFGTSFFVKAAESYTITISLGSNKEAYFTNSSSRTKSFVLPTGKVKVSDLVKDIDIKAESDGSIKYSVKGIRFSGEDYVYTVDDSINVSRDETYVVAYGASTIQKYIVKYTDENGALLDESKLGAGVSNPEEFYGVYGEKILVPARHVQYYTPDEESKVVKNGIDSKNADGITEITFKYSKVENEVVKVVDKTTTVVVNDDPVIHYEYEYVDGPTAVSTTTNTNPQVVTNRTESSNNTGTVSNRQTSTSQVNTAQEQAGTLDEQTSTTAEGDGNSDADSADNTTISDEEVPLAGSDDKEEINIPEEDVPTAAQVKTSQRALIILIMLVLIVIAVFVIMYVMEQRKKAPITHRKKDKK